MFSMIEMCFSTSLIIISVNKPLGGSIYNFILSMFALKFSKSHLLNYKVQVYHVAVNIHDNSFYPQDLFFCVNFILCSLILNANFRIIIRNL